VTLCITTLVAAPVRQPILVNSYLHDMCTVVDRLIVQLQGPLLLSARAEQPTSSKAFAAAQFDAAGASVVRLMTGSSRSSNGMTMVGKAEAVKLWEGYRRGPGGEGWEFPRKWMRMLAHAVKKFIRFSHCRVAVQSNNCACLPGEELADCR